MWTPYVASTVTRMVLNELHPAFGSLHNCRTLRNLKLTLSFFDLSAMHSYIVQQTVHRVSAFVTDVVTAEDAIHVLKYLLDRGLVLMELSFLAGSLINLFLDIRSYLLRPQSSATQESQRRAVSNNIHSFHEWLTEYVARIEIIQTSTDGPTKRARAMLEAACQMSNFGNNHKDSHESALLLAILRDAGSSSPLLHLSMRNSVLSKLCNPFTPVSRSEEDCLHDVDPSTALLHGLWSTSQLKALDTRFYGWAGRTLGRAFSRKGPDVEDHVGQSKFTHLTALAKSSADFEPSKVAILRILADLLYSQNPVHVALAEQACRDTLAASHGRDASVEDVIWLPLVTALSYDEELQLARPYVLNAKFSAFEILLQELTAPSDHQAWLSDLTMLLASRCVGEPILSALLPILEQIPTVSDLMFPFVLHLCLQHWRSTSDSIQSMVSEAFHTILSAGTSKQQRILLSALLYLRSRPCLYETTALDRTNWLGIDNGMAASAAASCKMYETAFLYIESAESVASAHGNSRSARRGSTINPSFPHELLLEIAQNVDEPDSFYGVENAPSLSNIADRLLYEGTAVDALLLKGSQLDSMAGHTQAHEASSLHTGVLSALLQMNMNSLVSELATDLNPSSAGNNSNFAYESATKLQKWDLPVASASTSSDAGNTVYTALQTAASVEDTAQIRIRLDAQILRLYRGMTAEHNNTALKRRFTELASLTEMSDYLAIERPDDLLLLDAQAAQSDSWMKRASLEYSSTIVDTRWQFAELVTTRSHLQAALKLNGSRAYTRAVTSLCNATKFYRAQGALQDALGCVSRMDRFRTRAPPELHVDAAVEMETSQLLWDRGEYVASIRMMQGLQSHRDLAQQTIAVDRASLLATLGRHVSDARLERPDEIMNKYLKPALKSLAGSKIGATAGTVYHELASYCHGQLMNPELVAELNRSEKFQRLKDQELKELRALAKGSDDEHAKREAKRDISRSSQWLKLDQVEYNRLRKTRQELLRASLENYLSSLSAADEHDTDILRFLSLWLEHAEDDEASSIVAKYITQVPSRKFITVINQLASRLQDREDTFHSTIEALVERICREHPYHGMYHVYAGWKTSGGNDPSAQSRNSAAQKIAGRLNGQQSDKRVIRIWKSIHRSCELYVHLANLRAEEMKAGTKLK